MWDESIGMFLENDHQNFKLGWLFPERYCNSLASIVRLVENGCVNPTAEHRCGAQLAYLMAGSGCRYNGNCCFGQMRWDLQTSKLHMSQVSHIDNDDGCVTPTVEHRCGAQLVYLLLMTAPRSPFPETISNSCSFTILIIYNTPWKP